MENIHRLDLENISLFKIYILSCYYIKINDYFLLLPF